MLALGVPTPIQECVSSSYVACPQGQAIKQKQENLAAADDIG